MKTYTSLIVGRFLCVMGALLMSWAGLTTQTQAACGTATQTVLLAGQSIPAGLVEVENDEQFLYVNYLSDGDWLITETHLAVATQPEDLPQTKKGNAIPGRFAYKTTHPSGVSEVTHILDLSAWPTGSQLYIAAHSVVVSNVGSETAWGEGLGFPGADWSMYFSYTVQPCSPPPVYPGVIEFDQPDIDVLESGYSITVHLVRNGGSDGDVEVTLAYEDLGATRDDDYHAPISTVFFNDGETSKDVEIFILNDEIDEIDESFSVQIVDVVGAQIGPQSEMICTIVDDDDLPANPGYLAFADEIIFVNEDDGAITIDVVRTDGSDGAVSVDYIITGDTATPDSDYQAASGTLYFEEGETTKSFTITILDDVEVENTEAIVMELTNPVGAMLGTPFLAEVNILDNDMVFPQ